MTQPVPATLDDLAALTDLENRTFPCDQITRRQFRYLLSRAHGITVKLMSGSKLTAYMVLLMRRGSSSMRIYSLAVDAASRRHGHASRLLDYAEEAAILNNCSRLTLEVSEQNRAAHRLYESRGFQVYGRKAAYYEDGTTALCMHKILNTEASLQ